MRNDADFWRRMCIVLMSIIILIVGVSAYYGSSSDNSDIVRALEDIESELGSIHYELSSMELELNTIASHLDSIRHKM